MALTLNDGGNNEAGGGFGLVWMIIILIIEGGIWPVESNGILKCDCIGEIIVYKRNLKRRRLLKL